MPSFPGTEDALNFIFIVAIILTFLFVTHVAFGLFTPYYIYKQRFGKIDHHMLVFVHSGELTIETKSEIFYFF